MMSTGGKVLKDCITNWKLLPCVHCNEEATWIKMFSVSLVNKNMLKRLSDLVER